MSAELAVQVVWWVGLIAALGLTVVAVKLLALLLRTLGQIRELADRTATAAEGIADAFAGPLRLAEATEAAEGVRAGAAALRRSAARVWRAVDGERREPERDGEEQRDGGGPGAGELGGAAGGPASGGGAE